MAELATLFVARDYLLALLRSRRASLWRTVHFGSYALMQQGCCVLLIKNGGIVWSLQEMLRPCGRYRG